MEEKKQDNLEELNLASVNNTQSNDVINNDVALTENTTANVDLQSTMLGDFNTPNQRDSVISNNTVESTQSVSSVDMNMSNDDLLSKMNALNHSVVEPVAAPVENTVVEPVVTPVDNTVVTPVVEQQNMVTNDVLNMQSVDAVQPVPVENAVVEPVVAPVENTVVTPVVEQQNMVTNDVLSTQSVDTVQPVPVVAPVAVDVNDLDKTTLLDPIKPETVNAVENNINPAPAAEVTNTDSTNVQGKTKVKRYNFLTIILLLLVAAGVGSYLYFKTRPENEIFAKALIDEFAYLTQDIEFNNSIYEEAKNSSVLHTGTVDTNIKVSDPSSEVIKYTNAISNLDFDYNIGLDYKNKKGYVGINSKYEGNELINMNLYNTNDKSYAFLNNMFSKYIEIDNFKMDSLYENNTISQNDYVYLMKTVVLTTLDSLEVNDFERDHNYIIFKLNNESYKKVGKNVVVKLANDKKFIETYAKVTSKTEDVVLRELENANFDTVNIEETNIRLSIGRFNKPDKLVIETESPNESTTYIYRFEDVRSLNISHTYLEEEENTTVTYEREENGSVLILKDHEADLVITINKDVKDNTTTRKFNMTSNSKEIVTGSLVNTKEKMSRNDKFTISFKDESEKEMFNLTIDHKLNTKIGDEIKIPKMDNVVKSDEMTEADSQELQNGITNNLVLKKLIEDLTPEQSEDIIDIDEENVIGTGETSIQY